MDILATIPHRPPFLFVDKVLEVTADGAVAEREIRADEPQFEGHYPGNPIMPGVLLCEATFQVGAIYLVEKMRQEGGSAEGLTPILARIGDARFKQMIKPGDTIRIEVSFKETLSRFHFMKGKILKDGKPALTIEFALALIDETKQ